MTQGRSPSPRSSQRRRATSKAASSRSELYSHRGSASPPLESLQLCHRLRRADRLAAVPRLVLCTELERTRRQPRSADTCHGVHGSRTSCWRRPAVRPYQPLLRNVETLAVMPWLLDLVEHRDRQVGRRDVGVPMVVLEEDVVAQSILTSGNLRLPGPEAQWW